MPRADRVDDLLSRLHEMEALRRMSAPSGAMPDHAVHNRLANEIRQVIADMDPADLRSLVIRLVVDTVNGTLWPRCDGCGRPTYRGLPARTS